VNLRIKLAATRSSNPNRIDVPATNQTRICGSRMIATPPSTRSSPGIIASSPSPHFPEVFLNIADIGQDSIGLSSFVSPRLADVGSHTFFIRAIIGLQQSGIEKFPVSSVVSSVWS